MRRYTIHIPHADNDGVLHGKHDVFVDNFTQRFGGCTCIDAVGYWYTFTDEQRMYVIDTDESRDTADSDLFWMAKEIRRQLKQESVYVTVQELETHFVI